MKYDESDEERSYFYEIFGDAVVYKDSARAEFSSYKAIDKARLSITGYSACAGETVGMGRRAMFVNSLAHSSVAMPGVGFYYLEGRAYSAFRDRVKEASNSGDVEYSRLSKEARRQFMNYDLNMLPHNKIRQEILNTVRR